MDEIDRLRDDSEQYARDLRARGYRLRHAQADDARPAFWTKTYPVAKRQADEAWALGRSIAATGVGRAAFERAWLLATGVPWTYPPDDDTPHEHAPGLHYADTARRTFASDLPPAAPAWTTSCGLSSGSAAPRGSATDAGR